MSYHFDGLGLHVGLLAATSGGNGAGPIPAFRDAEGVLAEPGITSGP